MQYRVYTCAFIYFMFNMHSVIADSGLQQAFAVATGNFRSISALKSIHILDR